MVTLLLSGLLRSKVQIRSLQGMDVSSVATASCLSLDLGFSCFIWGCGVFVENLFFFTLVKFL